MHLNALENLKKIEVKKVKLIIFTSHIMFSKKSIVYFTTFLILAFTFVKPVIADDDDDDNILGEIVVDLMVGAFVAACETSVTCSYYMNILAVFFMIVSIITCCINGPGSTMDEWGTSRNARRAGTAYMGYRLMSRH